MATGKGVSGGGGEKYQKLSKTLGKTGVGKSDSSQKGNENPRTDLLEKLDLKPNNLYKPIVFTFGIELEFLVKYKKEDFQAAQDRLDDGKDEFGDSLAEEIHKRVIDLMRIEGHAINDFWSPNKDPLQWTVKEDASIDTFEVDDPDGFSLEKFGFAPMELNSPVQLYTENAFGEITKFLETLQKHFPLFTNPSCGFHVHVGGCAPNDPEWNLSKGFPMRTLRNFCHFTTIFEPQINELHPADRVGKNRFCVPPSHMHSTSRTQIILDHVDNCKTILRLVDFWEDEEYVWTTEVPEEAAHAYKLKNLLNEWEAGKKKRQLRTVEFRQHQGTKDPDEISYWVSFCVKSLLYCHQCSYLGLNLELIAKSMSAREDPEKYTVVHLLKDLGMNAHAVFYSTRRFLHPKRDDPLGCVRGKEHEMKNNPNPRYTRITDDQVLHRTRQGWHVDNFKEEDFPSYDDFMHPRRKTLQDAAASAAGPP